LPKGTLGIAPSILSLQTKQGLTQEVVH
jgi:hypothetical protein